MTNSIDFLQVCPPPEDRPNDLIPMLVMLAVFLFLGWLFRRWKKRRRTMRKQSNRK